MVSNILGYADISITLRVYAHVTPHMQQAAVAVMDALFYHRPETSAQILYDRSGAVMEGTNQHNSLTESYWCCYTIERKFYACKSIHGRCGVANELSDPQAKIYHFIGEYTRRYGRPPTNREIGEAVHTHSTGYVDYHLTILENKGYIQRERRTSRGIWLTEAQGLRIAGTIAAGAPLDIYSPAQQEMLDLSTHTGEYVLLVRGHSMIEDSITDGDYVLVDKNAYINDGDIIVATHKVGNAEGGEATLKRIYRDSDHIRLQPANSAVNPIIVTPGGVG